MAKRFRIGITYRVQADREVGILKNFCVIQLCLLGKLTKFNLERTPHKLVQLFCYSVLNIRRKLVQAYPAGNLS